jgi:hypothetical protein
MKTRMTQIKAMIRMISPNKYETVSCIVQKRLLYGSSLNSNIVIKQSIQLLLGGTQLIFLKDRRET